VTKKPPDIFPPSVFSRLALPFVTFHICSLLLPCVQTQSYQISYLLSPIVATLNDDFPSSSSLLSVSDVRSLQLKSFFVSIQPAQICTVLSLMMNPLMVVLATVLCKCEVRLDTPFQSAMITLSTMLFSVPPAQICSVLSMLMHPLMVVFATVLCKLAVRFDTSLKTALSVLSAMLFSVPVSLALATSRLATPYAVPSLVVGSLLEVFATVRHKFAARFDNSPKTSSSVPSTMLLAVQVSLAFVSTGMALSCLSMVCLCSVFVTQCFTPYCHD